MRRPHVEAQEVPAIVGASGQTREIAAQNIQVIGIPGQKPMLTR